MDKGAALLFHRLRRLLVLVLVLVLVLRGLRRTALALDHSGGAQLL
jgi:hypothetical protein